MPCVIRLFHIETNQMCAYLLCVCLLVCLFRSANMMGSIWDMYNIYIFDSFLLYCCVAAVVRLIAYLQTYSVEILRLIRFSFSLPLPITIPLLITLPPHRSRLCSFFKTYDLHFSIGHIHIDRRSMARQSRKRFENSWYVYAHIYAMSCGFFLLLFCFLFVSILPVVCTNLLLLLLLLLLLFLHYCTSTIHLQHILHLGPSSH